MEENELAQGEIVSCCSCQRARPIETPVLELFGSRVAFGPGGETDMFVERDGEITCYWCEDDVDELLE